jgi:hypothetical protein
MTRALIVALILMCASAAAFDSTRWIPVKGGTWEPSAAVLSDLEAALKPSVTAASQNRGRIPLWSAYTFQYQGRTQLFGQRYAYVNAFCFHTGTHLEREWVNIEDGGACFFSAKYDPQKKVVYDIPSQWCRVNHPQHRGAGTPELRTGLPSQPPTPTARATPPPPAPAAARTRAHPTGESRVSNSRHDSWLTAVLPWVATRSNDAFARWPFTIETQVYTRLTITDLEAVHRRFHPREQTAKPSNAQLGPGRKKALAWRAQGAKRATRHPRGLCLDAAEG